MLHSHKIALFSYFEPSVPDMIYYITYLIEFTLFLRRNDYETLTLDEAQVRYELDQLKKQLSKKLEERDEAHADRIRALEQTLHEKECDWVTKNENLRRDLRTAIRSSIQDTEREVESIDNLEQVYVFKQQFSNKFKKS